jgi:hypothetical protein
MNGIKNNRGEGIIDRRINCKINGIENNSEEGIKGEENEFQNEWNIERQGRRN